MNVAPRFSPSPDTRQRVRAGPDALEIFKLRCWARAELFAACELDLHTAVDALWQFAVENGLTRRIGIDAVQKLIADAFHRHRARERP
jgi:hypothetical protein